MGNANRFLDSKAWEIPGPNNYKIDGFADTMLKFYEKRENLKSQSQMKKSASQNFLKSANKTGFSNISHIARDNLEEDLSVTKFGATSSHYFPDMK